MDMLAAIPWKQLGVSGILVAFLAYLYIQERNERRFWQDKAFDLSEVFGEKLSAAVSTIDQAMKMLKP